MERATRKFYDSAQCYLKAISYCAFQERSQQEVRDKLYFWGLTSKEVEPLISRLIEENFLNEERFAIAYAGGKFRIKHWGKVKIKQGLKAKSVSDACIKKALNSIDLDDYRAVLEQLLHKKLAGKKSSSLLVKHKAAQYAISRGFESNLVWELLHDSEAHFD